MSLARADALTRANGRAARFPLYGAITVFAATVVMTAMFIFNPENQWVHPEVLYWHVPNLMDRGGLTWSARDLLLGFDTIAFDGGYRTRFLGYLVSALNLKLNLALTANGIAHQPYVSPVGWACAVAATYYLDRTARLLKMEIAERLILAALFIASLGMVSGLVLLYHASKPLSLLYMAYTLHRVGVATMRAPQWRDHAILFAIGFVCLSIDESCLFAIGGALVFWAIAERPSVRHMAGIVGALFAGGIGFLGLTFALMPLFGPASPSGQFSGGLIQSLSIFMIESIFRTETVTQVAQSLRHQILRNAIGDGGLWGLAIATVIVAGAYLARPDRRRRQLVAAAIAMWLAMILAFDVMLTPFSDYGYYYGNLLAVPAALTIALLLGVALRANLAPISMVIAAVIVICTLKNAAQVNEEWRTKHNVAACSVFYHALGRLPPDNVWRAVEEAAARGAPVHIGWSEGAALWHQQLCTRVDPP